MSKSSDLGWSACRGWQPCNCLRMPEAIRFQESRMSGNLLVRFDEGRVGRIAKMSPSLLLYLEMILPARVQTAKIKKGQPVWLPLWDLRLQERSESRGYGAHRSVEPGGVL